jgi:uncharacterized protein GlcG (DUF336 family)
VPHHPLAVWRSCRTYFCCRARLEIKVDADAIGAIGVGGAPGGDLDEACAKTGLDKISGRLK